MKVAQIVLRKLNLPLIKPYKVSYRSYASFDPFFVEVRDRDGSVGWGEGLISPGASEETQEGGWKFLREHAQQAVGKSATAAKGLTYENLSASPIAATALVTAMEMLERNDALRVVQDHRVPLLTLVVEHEREKIPSEVERLIAEGFKALKVKVGFDFDQDVRRVTAIQHAANGRARITLDANRAFDRDTAIRFARALDPQGIDQLEQPCAAADWEANAAVAAASAIPVMLDESVMTMGDIERAAGIPGIRFVKLKLRKLGSVAQLAVAIRRIEELGMSAVLGDGTSTEVHCWMEACIARMGVSTPGQMNGFLKIRNNLFTNPLRFEHGEVRLQAGFWPQIDQKVLERHTVTALRFC